VGGGFGLILGKVVSIESHFFIRSPASKIAILSTCWRARAAGAQYIDLQWFTEHGYQAGGSETNVDLRLLAAEGTIVLSDREVDASEIVAAYGS
jgi:Leu/Phe-tRNA-protein transferase